MWVIPIVTLPITALITTHEPPSTQLKAMQSLSLRTTEIEGTLEKLETRPGNGKGPSLGFLWFGV